MKACKGFFSPPPFIHICFNLIIGVRAIFYQGGGGGGAVNHLPKKFSQVAQIFTRQSKTNEGHTMRLR